MSNVSIVEAEEINLSIYWSNLKATFSAEIQYC